MNPKGEYLFEVYTRLSYVRVASCTSHTLPCLNTEQVAVKVISKDKRPLNGITMKNLTYTTFSLVFYVLMSQMVHADITKKSISRQIANGYIGHEGLQSNQYKNGETEKLKALFAHFASPKQVEKFYCM